MAVATTQLAQVVGYVPRELRQKIDQLRSRDRRLSMSQIVEEALTAHIDDIEKRLKSRPSKR